MSGGPRQGGAEMPRRRRIDLLPEALRSWLQEELRARGFADYDAVTDALNARLEAGGLELRIGRSAVHAYGREFKAFAVMQDQAQDEIRAFLEDASLKDEVDVTSALFQQLTTIQWRLQMAMADPDNLPDPRGMKDLSTALNALIRSTGLRRGILAGAAARYARPGRARGAAWSLLPYQRAWRETAPLAVIEKSRRIGISWAEAYHAVMHAADDRGDIYYQSYDRDMTRGFIEDCAAWIGRLDVPARQVGEQILDNDGRDIQVFRINFASGRRIIAMTSSPRGFRSKGRAISRLSMRRRSWTISTRC